MAKIFKHARAASALTEAQSMIPALQALTILSPEQMAQEDSATLHARFNQARELLRVLDVFSTELDQYCDALTAVAMDKGTEERAARRQKLAREQSTQ